MSQHGRQSDRNAVGLPSRLIELRTFACFPVSQHTKMSLRLMVGALTSIWQVGVPPAEAQGVDSANSLFYKKGHM